MRAGVVALAFACVAVAALSPDAWASAPGSVVTLDDFESVAAWSAHPADGVEVAIGQDAGVRGRSMRLDIRFVKGGGYAVVRRALPLVLPPNYRLRFQVRGNVPANDLEVKLIAPDGENVWWRNQRMFEFPASWTPVSIRKRQIEFAWGPAGGGELREVGLIEFAVTAGNGGAGTVWIDELVLEPMPEATALPAPVARASTARGRDGALQALDGRAETAWRPAARDRSPHLDLDLGVDRELGGLVLTWGDAAHAPDYDVLLSADGSTWTRVRAVRRSDGGRDVLHLPEHEGRFLRVQILPSAQKKDFALAEIEVKPVTWAPTQNELIRELAKAAPRGEYPRAMLGEQSYWTVVGMDAHPDEALIDEDGRIEIGKAQLSLEPFIYAGGQLITWADATTGQGLEGGHLPLPWVTWRHAGLSLTVQTFVPADSLPLRAPLLVRYRVKNAGSGPARGTLYLALRPFQVNPPQQFLNTRGGVARTTALAARDGVIQVNGAPRVRSLSETAGFGAATYDEGGIMPLLRRDALPARTEVEDATGLASGALRYPFELNAGEERVVDLLVSLEDADTLLELAEGPDMAERGWDRRLRGARITLPDSEIVRTLEAQVGWILVNRDGAAIQPGSRAYERSWIRDGSLTSSALLRLGHHDVVREFIEWFAPYQYDDGKVPCCVDRRGSDPVPEHDSHGEFIFLVAEYARHTQDRAFAERLWPRVASAAGYLEALRQQRRSDEYRRPANAHFYGLLPPSISHEGYSAKPMHSYWDDFFALKGFEDAAWLAEFTDQPGEAVRWHRIGDEFRTDLVASIEASMRVHGIAYIPGAADLGDFDATSTTIALSPVDATDRLPRAALERTFERYWEFFIARRDGTRAWQDMTPYELRNVGAFVRLGWRDRAHELLDWFMTLRRPAGWAHWAEVVAKDPREARFLGDMPHTWVGSDYVRSVLDMLAYERAADAALVIGAGVTEAWLAGEGVGVEGLSTAYGRLGYTMRRRGRAMEVEIQPLDRIPVGGIVITPPGASMSRATADVRLRSEPDGSVRIHALPARLVFTPK